MEIIINIQQTCVLIFCLAIAFVLAADKTGREPKDWAVWLFTILVGASSAGAFITTILRIWM